MNKDFLDTILGPQTAGVFFASLFFALVGVAVSLLMQSSKREVNSIRTPFHFTWSFLWCDNLKRLLTGFLLILISIRFSSELLHITLTPFLSLVLGFGWDKLAQYLKDSTSLLGQKQTHETT